MEEKFISAKKLLDEICDEYTSHDKGIMQGVDGEKAHALEVLRWVEKLKPRSPLSLKLAALFHDIDRVVTPQKGGGFKGDRKSKAYLKHKKGHAKRSTSYILPRLKALDLDNEILERTKFLIRHHDDTGTEIEKLNDTDLNCLVAADAFAFFTSILPKLLETEGKERLKDKIRFMVDKIPDDLRSKLLEFRFKNSETNKVKDEIIEEYYRWNNPENKLYKFCPNCSYQLANKNISGRKRPVCEKCSFIFWGNPRLCTSVILEHDGKILLLKRKQQPLEEFWCLPGGIVEYHELVEEALIREVREEINCKIGVDKLIGIYQIDNDPRGVGQDVIYSGKIKTGQEEVGEEHSEAKYFSPSELPEKIAYKHRLAIGDYFNEE